MNITRKIGHPFSYKNKQFFMTSLWQIVHSFSSKAEFPISDKIHEVKNTDNDLFIYLVYVVF